MSNDRTKYIGGSDIGKIAGLSPYGSPMDVFLEKRGLVAEKEDNEAMRWGRDLEDVICRRYASDTGLELVPGKFTKHPAHEWAAGTPDRIAPKEGVLLEVKTANIRQAWRWGDEGTDEVPPEYLAQVAWYLAVTNLQRADIAVLLAGNDFRVYHLERDRELEAGLLDLAERFWREHIVADVAPPVDASQASRRWLESKFPRAIGEVREATEAEAKLMKAYEHARRESKKWDEEKRTIGAEICKAIGDAQSIVWDGSKASWSNRKGFIRPAVEIAAGRQLRVSIKGNDDE